MGNYDGWRGLTEADLQRLRTRTKAPAVAKRRSKFNAQPTMVDGLRFDSKREAAYYQTLKIRLRAGDIRNLKVQPRYHLCPLIIEHADPRNVNLGENSPRRVPCVEYRGDFEFEERDSSGWVLVVADAKGMKTDVYRLKRRWFELQYGITIREI